jgi:YD repeat-containing protein
MERRLARATGIDPPASPDRLSGNGAEADETGPTSVLSLQSNQLAPGDGAKGGHQRSQPLPELSQLAAGAAYRRPEVPEKAGLSATARLRSHPDYLVFARTADGLLPQEQTLEISSSTGESLAFTATESIPWLSLDSSGGTATDVPLVINVSVDPTGLDSTASPYTGTITLTSTSDPTDQRLITARLTVRDEHSDASLQSFGSSGFLQRVVKPDGSVIDYLKDGLGRLTRVRYPDGSTVEYTYDGNGNLEQLVDQHGTTVFQYDAKGRLAAVYYPGLNPIRYAHDKSGNLELLTYPDGNEVQYKHDSDGRMTRIESALGVASYTYDPVTGTLATQALPNGCTTSFTYDADRG